MADPAAAPTLDHEINSENTQTENNHNINDNSESHNTAAPSQSHTSSLHSSLSSGSGSGSGHVKKEVAFASAISPLKMRRAAAKEGLNVTIQTANNQIIPNEPVNNNNNQSQGSPLAEPVSSSSRGKLLTLSLTLNAKEHNEESTAVDELDETTRLKRERQLKRQSMPERKGLPDSVNTLLNK